jgi:hypothetical protein
MLLGLGTALATTTHAASDLAGVWIVTGYSPALKTSDGKAPPLLPEAAKRYAERQALLAKGDASFDIVASRCGAPGMPRVMMLPYDFEIVQNPHRLVFLFQWNRLYRRVDIGEPSHDAEDFQWSGRSVAHWDNDTLVIDTGQIDDTLLDAAGMPHSDVLKITERLRLLDDGTLQNRMRFEDPKTFAQPWDTEVTYRKLPSGTEVGEDICLDRLRTTAAIDPKNYFNYPK